MFVPIVHQDEDLLVVNKPIGLTTHASESGDPASDNVVNIVKQQLGLSYLGVHHRLDREVSGVLAFAVRKQANAGLAQVFEGRSVEKEYIALVAGRLPKMSGIIDAPLIEVESGRYAVASRSVVNRVQFRSQSKSQEARTTYQVLQQAPDQSWSLVRLQPDTGRTHQLRVHLAYVAAPIIGDSLYGPAHPAPRLLLHASLLRFKHPITGELVTFEAPPPAIFERAKRREDMSELKLAKRLASSTPSSVTLTATDEKALGYLLDLALSRRAPFSADTIQATNVYRLLNGAADGFPNLAVDRYGEQLFISTLATPPQSNGPRNPPTLSSSKVMYPEKILQQLLEARQPGCRVQQNLNSSAVAFKENGLNFARVGRVGIFASEQFRLDLREMRERVQAWSKQQRVLIGLDAVAAGFGVVAKAGGASQVFQIGLATNSSLALATKDFILNGFTLNPADFLEVSTPQAALLQLEKLNREGTKFDLMVLDTGYNFTNGGFRLVARLLAAGGRLVVISDLDQFKALRREITSELEVANFKPGTPIVYNSPALDFPRPDDVESTLKVLVWKPQPN
jgi:23S rRNA (cytosine1962-C5)-methyltransferase